MANAEDSEPLLGPNMDSSIWTVSPRSKVCACEDVLQAANFL